MSHRGIELRISIPEGPLLLTNSDVLHIHALANVGEGHWGEILRTTDGLVLESRAITLPDQPAADDEDEDDQAPQVDQAPPGRVQPGQVWIDEDGDNWEVGPDRRLVLGRTHAPDLIGTFEYVNKQFGPLTLTLDVARMAAEDDQAPDYITDEELAFVKVLRELKAIANTLALFAGS